MYKENYYQNVLSTVDENEADMLIDLIMPHKDIIAKVIFLFSLLIFK